MRLVGGDANVGEARHVCLSWKLFHCTEVTNCHQNEESVTVLTYRKKWEQVKTLNTLGFLRYELHVQCFGLFIPSGADSSREA